jgi:hypothetical protein
VGSSLKVFLTIHTNYTDAIMMIAKILVKQERLQLPLMKKILLGIQIRLTNLETLNLVYQMELKIGRKFNGIIWKMVSYCCLFVRSCNLLIIYLFLLIEHFIVWMRTAGLPNFRKLWGKIDGELPEGSY